MQTDIIKSTGANILNVPVNDADLIKPFQWTQEKYYQMAELGFFQGKRVELIEGEIIEMSPMNKPHATAIRKLLKTLNHIFPNGYLVDSQLPMSFSKISEPEPDIAIIKGEIDDFADSHPKTAELIIEVSDATLYYDRNRKASLYAKNKIQDYWILNLKNNRLEVYRRPIKDKTMFYGFGYAESVIFTESDEVSPLAQPDAKIKVSDLLP
jgi:Uma2 family endonuclease